MPQMRYYRRLTTLPTVPSAASSPRATTSTRHDSRKGMAPISPVAPPPARVKASSLAGVATLRMTAASIMSTYQQDMPAAETRGLWLCPATVSVCVWGGLDGTFVPFRLDGRFIALCLNISADSLYCVQRRKQGQRHATLAAEHPPATRHPCKSSTVRCTTRSAPDTSFLQHDAPPPPRLFQALHFALLDMSQP